MAKRVGHKGAVILLALAGCQSDPVNTSPLDAAAVTFDLATTRADLAGGLDGAVDLAAPDLARPIDAGVDLAAPDLSSGCGIGLTRCNGACVDLSRDGANCGGCGKACGPNINCANGLCGAMMCQGGLVMCNGQC